MFCNQCGNKVAGESKYCSKCGNLLGKEEEFVIDFEKATREEETTKLKKMIADIKIALPIYKVLSEGRDEINVLEYKRDRKWGWLLNIVGYIIATTIVNIPIMMVLQMLLSVNYNFVERITPFALVVIYILGGVVYYWYRMKLKKDYNSKIEQKENELRQYLEKNNCPELYALPERYQNYIAGSYIYECLTNGRASTLKEALNLYEQQVHIWEMELKQQKIENELVRQQQAYSKAKRDQDLLTMILLLK